VGVHTGGAEITGVPPHPALPPPGGKEPSSVDKSRAEQYWKKGGMGERVFTSPYHERVRVRRLGGCMQISSSASAPQLL
jgi:hypothetical protein